MSQESGEAVEGRSLEIRRQSQKKTRDMYKAWLGQVESIVDSSGLDISSG